VLAHASSIHSGQKGVVLAGTASAGKTTLAFRMLEQGASLVGKDNLILRREDGSLRMHGTPAPPRVNPGTALHSSRLRTVLDPAYVQKLERLSREELWEIEKKHEVVVEDLYGRGSVSMDGPADAIIVLNWQLGAAATCIGPVALNERRDLLAILMRSRGVFYQPLRGAVDPEPGEDDYLAVLEGCPAYEITGGVDFERAAAFCAGLLSG
jgi:HprK-related kinase B